MQSIPETWPHLRFRYGLGADPYEPRENILAAAAYLRELHDRYVHPAFWTLTIPILRATKIV